MEKERGSFRMKPAKTVPCSGGEKRYNENTVVLHGNDD